MVRRLLSRLPLLAFAGLAACVVNLSLEMDQPNLALQAPTAGNASQSVQVNLGNYKEISSHKDHIRSLDLDYVDVTVTAVNAGNQAKVLNGSITLRRKLGDPASNDVKVGDLVNLPVNANSTVRIKGNAALDAFLLEQLQNGGAFLVMANGRVDDKTDLVLDLNLHASIGYDAGMF
jgi:hypothetical protein